MKKILVQVFMFSVSILSYAEATREKPVIRDSSGTIQAEVLPEAARTRSVPAGQGVIVRLTPVNSNKVRNMPQEGLQNQNYGPGKVKKFQSSDGSGPAKNF